jgi:hypothetical protein
MRESLIENEVCKKAKTLGWLTYKFGSVTTRGLPDRVFLRYGYLFFVEFKARGKEPRLFQQRIIKLLIKHGFDVYVIDSIEQGFEILQRYENSCVQ